jgi:aspartyl-tRNA(Asn)/glutamyl-tRNA(Gln) amidotransferase subunit A
MADIHDRTAAALAKAFAKGKLSPVEVAKHMIARRDRFEPQVNAFSFTDDAVTLKQARASEKRWKAGEPASAFDGVPCTIKGNIMVKGYPFTRGSKLVDETPMVANAPIADRLIEAGCVVIGQTTMPEFGWKGLGDSPRHGPVRNPWNLTRSTGGSSAGAVAAAALGIGVFHVGTDGLGSIRIPCAFTGVAGIKPSFGRVPAWPASPMGLLAKLGPIARRVEDVAAMFALVGRPDARDPFATREPVPKVKLGRGVKGLRIGWSRDLGYAKGLDPEVEAICRKAVKALAGQGAKLADAKLTLEDPIALALTYWHAGSATIIEGIPEARWGELDPGFLKGALIGRDMPAAQLARAMAERAALYLKLMDWHQDFDLLLTPAMPTPAMKLGSDTPPDGSFGDHWTNWSNYTYPFNLTGQPAGSVPVGLTKAGLPVGLQIVGRPGADAQVLAAMAAMEQIAGFSWLDAPRG